MGLHDVVDDGNGAVFGVVIGGGGSFGYVCDADGVEYSWLLLVLIDEIHQFQDDGQEWVEWDGGVILGALFGYLR